MKPAKPGPAALLAALALLVPSAAHSEAIAYLANFSVVAYEQNVDDLFGSFSIPLTDAALIELPRYSGSEPLTSVGISLLSGSARTLTDLYAMDALPNAELVAPEEWLWYGNDASVEATIDGELGLSLFAASTALLTKRFPELAAECHKSTADAFGFPLAVCGTNNYTENVFSGDIPAAGISLANFVGNDPIAFLLTIDGAFSGLCGGPDPGPLGGFDSCGAALAAWVWRGTLIVTYTYGATSGEVTTGGGETTGGGATTGDVPEPLGLMAVGVAIAGLRRVISRTGRCRASRYLGMAALVIGLPASTAHAAPITLDYHVSVTSLGPIAPVDPVTFTFHLTVDDAVTVTDQTDGLTVTDSNIALPSTIAFRYVAVGDGGLRIYGLQSGFNLLSGTDDFEAKFFFFGSTLLLEEFFYIQADTPRGVLFWSGDGVVSPVSGSGGTTGDQSTDEVPEPVGLVAIGVALTGLRRLLR